MDNINFHLLFIQILFFFNSVNYSQTLVHNMHLIEFKDYVKAFFTKDPYWQYENEYRLLTFKDKLENGYKLKKLYKIKKHYIWI